MDTNNKGVGMRFTGVSKDVLNNKLEEREARRAARAAAALVAEGDRIGDVGTENLAGGDQGPKVTGAVPEEEREDPPPESKAPALKARKVHVHSVSYPLSFLNPSEPLVVTPLQSRPPPAAKKAASTKAGASKATVGVGTSQAALRYASVVERAEAELAEKARAAEAAKNRNLRPIRDHVPNFDALYGSPSFDPEESSEGYATSVVRYTTPRIFRQDLAVAPLRAIADNVRDSFLSAMRAAALSDV